MDSRYQCWLGIFVKKKGKEFYEKYESCLILCIRRRYEVSLSKCNHGYTINLCFVKREKNYLPSR